MILIDKFSLYYTVVFLSTKLAKITLKVLQAYHIEVEHQTGKKLHYIWLDIRREWFNQIWEKYRATYRLVFELIIPYAY